MKPLPTVAAAPAPTPAVPATGWPLLRLGFRPFYLGAALFAAISVPLWVAMLLGWATPPMPIAPLMWHAHEMLFGFAAAVIIGFLLTAARAWTGLPTPRGAVLGALALLWLAARLAAWVAPYAWYAALDLLLLPLAAALVGAVLLRARNRRNLPLVALLLLLALANAGFHFGMLGLWPIAPLTALHAGLALIVMIECIMAGRVIPAFTMNATPGMKARISHPLEVATLALTALALAAWVLAPAQAASSIALTGAALLHVWRLWGWQPWVTRRRPILWILHAAYAWIPLGLALLALGAWAGIGASPGIHALAVGATGGLIIGMITRTARGHTGRPLMASRPEVAAYVLVLGAALLRTLGPWLLSPSAALVLAALAWSMAFGIYLWVFAPWLMRTRLDGKDG